MCACEVRKSANSSPPHTFVCWKACFHEGLNPVLRPFPFGISRTLFAFCVGEHDSKKDPFPSVQERVDNKLDHASPLALAPAGAARA